MHVYDYDVPGPPPHWVERVLQGAPGLLEPSAREQVETAQTTRAPVELSPLPFAQSSIDEQRTATVTEPPRPARLRPPLVSRPRTMREGPRVAAEPSAAEAPVDPDPTAHQAVTVVRPRRRTTVTPEPTTLPGPSVLHDRPPSPPVPPAATAVEQRTPSARTIDPVAPAPLRVPAASPVPATAALAVVISPVPEVVAGLPATVVPLRDFGSPAPPGPASRHLHPRVSADHAGVSGDRRPWPELPPPAVQHDVDLGATLRAWDRERRLDREQAGL